MYYDLVILGATSAALGIAHELKQKYKTLIMSKSSMVGYEFINAYKLGTNWDKEPETELGKVMKKELLEEAIISDEEAYIYSAGAIFYKAFKGLGIDILLETEIMDLQRIEDNYEISIFNVGGYGTIKAKYLVDTTEEQVGIKEKSLNCLLTNKKKDKFPSLEVEEAQFYQERDDTINTVIMKYKCPIEASLYQTRHQLIEFWRQRSEEVADWKIAAIGLCFDITPQVGLKEIAKNYMGLPSAYYDNPLAAIDAGVKFGRSGAYDL